MRANIAERKEETPRKDEAESFLNDIKRLVVDFISSADETPRNVSNEGAVISTRRWPTRLLEQHSPKDLERLLNFSLPQEGHGKDGVMAAAQDILRYSVNTWDPGFMDKLYHSISPVGLAAELLLTTLNTNVHTYHVAPALTVIEKETTRALASMFGLTGPYAGGVSQSGGSAANQSSLVIARNTLFPETKTEGNAGRRFVLFTSEHGHYSLEKAAQISGFGSNAVRSIPVDDRGRMRPDALEDAVEIAKQEGSNPFYVNATAGTTVLGSFDPLDQIADICQKHSLWLHVDASWGGPIIFSEKQRHKLQGIERADSIAMCPHKMMGVPLTCSLLLGRDLRQFHQAMTLPAGYLFHNNDLESEDVTQLNGEPKTQEFWDLADLTPQCGRRGDVLKLALSWIHYGTSGYRDYIDKAFNMALHLAKLVDANPKFSLLSEIPPPCLQVCFYFRKQSGAGCREKNSKVTEEVTKALVSRRFMVDYAPGDEGKFFRVVVNGKTTKETVEELVEAIEEVGKDVSAC